MSQSLRRSLLATVFTGALTSVRSDRLAEQTRARTRGDTPFTPAEKGQPNMCRCPRRVSSLAVLALMTTLVWLMPTPGSSRGLVDAASVNVVLDRVPTCAKGPSSNSPTDVIDPGALSDGDNTTPTMLEAGTPGGKPQFFCTYDLLQPVRLSGYRVFQGEYSNSIDPVMNGCAMFSSSEVVLRGSWDGSIWTELGRGGNKVASFDFKGRYIQLEVMSNCWHYLAAVFELEVYSTPSPLLASALDTDPRAVVAPTYLTATYNPIEIDPLALPETTDFVEAPEMSLDSEVNPDVDLPVTPQVATLADPGGVQPLTTGLSSFVGQGQTSSGCVPADPSAAAGPVGIVETTNCGIHLYSLSGSSQKATSLSTWFGASGLFDPHVIYEPIGKRFVAIAINGTKIELSVSRTTNATGAWCNYELPALEGSGFADFPLLGSDNKHIYVTTTLYSSRSSSTVNGSRLLSIGRTNVETCSATGLIAYNNLKDPGTSNYAAHIAPAVLYDSSQPYGTLINSYANGGSHVSLWYLLNSDDSLHAIRRSVPSYSKPVPASQSGTSAKLDARYSDIIQAVANRNGSYAALTSSYNWGSIKTDVVYWLKFDGAPGIQYIHATGSFGSQSLSYFYPSMSGNYNGNAMFNFTIAGSSIHPSSGFMSMSSSGSLGALYYFDQGTASYASGASSACSGCYRWGDFSSVGIDANDATKFWIANMTVHATNTWGTRIGHVAP